MDLVEQLEILGSLGIRFQDIGKTVEHLNELSDPVAYFHEPFTLMRRFLSENFDDASAICHNVDSIDTECIYSEGDFATVVQMLANLTLVPKRVSDIKDEFNRKDGTAKIEYSLLDLPRTSQAKLNGDWLDVEAIFRIANDIAESNRCFFHQWYGQGIDFFYINPESATRLNELLQMDLQPLPV